MSELLIALPLVSFVSAGIILFLVHRILHLHQVIRLLENELDSQTDATIAI